MDKWTIYLLGINITTFIIYGIDKWSAIHGRRRIRVSTLLGLAFIGGSIGALCAMYLFRHKTLKPAFTIGVPFMMVLQVVGFVLYYIYD